MEKLLAPINQFLSCPTPQQWVTYAAKPEQLNDLLIDHCNCELKAAQTAIFLVRKYAVDKASAEKLLAWSKPYADYVYNKQRDTDAFLQRQAKKNELIGELTCQTSQSISQELVDKMVRLVKEEFHHFEQVLHIMHQRGITYSNRRAGRYAKALMSQVRTYEPAALIDKLIIGAIIEARSCERFAMLAPHLDTELERFYVSLLRSEARHYQDYLSLAQMLSNETIQPRVALLTDFEGQLISQPDEQFNFHSGIPKESIAF
ncbi:tRNA-(ms[2]io[6]A)-hydroxylase [Shewanella intestini]|uniref:tRNA-(Ms[2]io[6]A)-hydroxylase n=1 Tax=Shewanella intestini TaxID=2017544 RepID=A0ABS5I5H9_9GAMM|nr:MULTISPECIES: tRNA isopentenyl-2-thiomethyl-A-37 hydroxylase MiaE [Shewanella]MBR9729285.1 tRNA-(ms[2]io[6]A)-hydroxylase [Shewanella intestini]MRG35430.1 tRNA-(ms[2]io[6]A)-hydroxylase [Shewanella sp. XMDDZSB0408]